MNFATPIKYGAIGGAVLVTITLLMYLVYPTFFASFMSTALFLPVVFVMIWGGITYRTELGNEVSFGKVFLAVFIIAAVTLLLSTLFTYVLMNYIDPDLPIMIKRKVIDNTREMMEKFNVPDEDIEKGLANVEAEDFRPTPLKTFYRYAGSLGGFGIVALIISVFISRNPDRVRKPTFDEQGNYDNNSEAN
jgi:Na+/H+-dicarboxylate symporter